MGGSPGDVSEEQSSFSNIFRHFTYVTAHSPTLPSLYLRHSSFSNPSLALPTSQLILQPFRCFTYVTVHSPTLLSPLLRHRIFTYVTWRAAHATFTSHILQKPNVLSSFNPIGVARHLSDATRIILITFLQ